MNVQLALLPTDEPWHLLTHGLDGTRAPGILSLDPLTLQCGRCGDVSEHRYRAVGLAIILSGSGFHRHGDQTVRLCRECLDGVKGGCVLCRMRL